METGDQSLNIAEVFKNIQRARSDVMTEIREVPSVRRGNNVECHVEQFGSTEEVLRISCPYPYINSVPKPVILSTVLTKQRLTKVKHIVLILLRHMCGQLKDNV